MGGGGRLIRYDDYEYISLVTRSVHASLHLNVHTVAFTIVFDIDFAMSVVGDEAAVRVGNPGMSCRFVI